MRVSASWLKTSVTSVSGGIEIAELQRDCIVGTAQEAADRLSEYAEAGVQRVMLNHELFDDLDMLRFLAAEVFPAVKDT